jgi:hypothetical protein
MFHDCLKGDIGLSVLVKKNTFSFAIFYIITSCASVCLSSRLHQFKRSNMSPKNPPTNFKAHLRGIVFGWYTARTNICRAGHMNEPWPRAPAQPIVLSRLVETFKAAVSSMKC